MSVAGTLSRREDAAAQGGNAAFRGHLFQCEIKLQGQQETC